MARPQLLYLTPVVPALTGNGLAMRAGAVLEALARSYDITLLIAPIYLAPNQVPPPSLAAHCAQVALLPLGNGSTRPAGGRPVQILRALGTLAGHRPAPRLLAQRFEVVHLFRLASLPFAEPYLRQRRSRPVWQIDLDEIESVSALGLAELHRMSGQPDLAAAELAVAARAAALEADVLVRFDRVYVCSEADRAALQSRGAAEVRLLPNTVRLPTMLPATRSGPFTFIFVGTLGYAPNEDGLLYFAREVLPRLRRLATDPFRLLIVGRGAGPAVQRLGALPEVELVGEVDDLAPWYARADVAIVPLRVGGGTRIKILEAFAHRCPVVSTSVGAAGLAGRTGEHLLLADGPAELAAACVRLMADGSLRQRLVAAAFELVSEAYSIEAIANLLAVPPP